MRILWGLAVASMLASCAPAVPDSGAGVGFSDYDSYEAQRLGRSGGTAAAAGSRTDSRAISTEELRAAGLPAGGAGDGAQVASSSAEPSGAQAGSARIDLNNPRISDEQDFQAVSSRETIESDRERLEAQAERYRVIQPTALPQRTGQEGPNIVAYALRSSNQVGQSIYSRSGFRAEAKFNRACAQYASSDQAQQDFLAKGGPERDRMGVDPDGDGFACYWDPAPFRAARR